MNSLTYSRMQIIKGWNIPALTTAIRTNILSTGYVGDVAISFTHSYPASQKITVRKDNRSSRWFGALYWWWVSMLVWLGWPRASEWAGRWDVARGWWFFRREPGPDTPETGEGLKEGEWYKSWEPTIRRCVVELVKNSVPMTAPMERMELRAAMQLDGYTAS
jgi:hypothetical protein